MESDEVPVDSPHIQANAILRLVKKSAKRLSDNNPANPSFRRKNRRTITKPSRYRDSTDSSSPATSSTAKTSATKTSAAKASAAKASAAKASAAKASAPKASAPKASNANTFAPKLSVSSTKKLHSTAPVKTEPTKRKSTKRGVFKELGGTYEPVLKACEKVNFVQRLQEGTIKKHLQREVCMELWGDACRNNVTWIYRAMKPGSTLDKLMYARHEAPCKVENDESLWEECDAFDNVVNSPAPSTSSADKKSATETFAPKLSVASTNKPPRTPPIKTKNIKRKFYGKRKILKNLGGTFEPVLQACEKLRFVQRLKEGVIKAQLFKELSIELWGDCQKNNMTWLYASMKPGAPLAKLVIARHEALCKLEYIESVYEECGGLDNVVNKMVQLGLTDEEFQRHPQTSAVRLCIAVGAGDDQQAVEKVAFLWNSNKRNVRELVAARTPPAPPKTPAAVTYIEVRNAALWTAAGSWKGVVRKMKAVAVEELLDEKTDSKVVFKLLDEKIFPGGCQGVSASMQLLWLENLWRFNDDFRDKYRNYEDPKWAEVGGAGNLVEKMLAASFAPHYEANARVALMTLCLPLYNGHSPMKMQWLERVWTTNERRVRDHYWRTFDACREQQRRNAQSVDDDCAETLLDMAGGRDGVVQRMLTMDFASVYELNEKFALKLLAKRLFDKAADEEETDERTGWLRDVWESDAAGIRTQVVDALAAQRREEEEQYSEYLDS